MLDLALEYIKPRLQQYSSLDGTLFVAAGVAFLIFNNIAVYIAYAAIAYGIYKIIKNH